jgi:DNA-binding beta-propeller fold protein YncE
MFSLDLLYCNRKKDNVFVVDSGTQHVHKFDSNGDFITMCGSLGCKDNQFRIPHDITIDPEGNIYISNSGNENLGKKIYVN